MEIIWTLLIGLVVGALAKLLMPGKDPGGVIVTSIIGIVGASLAHFIGRAAGWYQAGEAPGFIASVGGAMLLLLGYRVIFARRTSPL